jgi:hypothetical protein
MEAELAAAGDNEEKKKKIRKKYALAQFAISASQIVTDTAVSIMKAFADLGPIAGLIASALLGATGAIQLATAHAEMNKVKSYAKGNYQEVLAEDGKKYRAQVVSPSHRSGLFSNPTFVPGFGLFGETAQPELVFNPRDTAAIMNAPGLVNAINATLGSVVPQYARGNAREIIRESSTTTVDPASIQIMAELRDELRKGIQAKLIASETYYRTHNEGADRLSNFKQKLP